MADAQTPDSWTRDQWLGGQDAESLNLKQKIEALEEEKSRLIHKNEEQSYRIKKLMDEIEEFKNKQIETEERLDVVERAEVLENKVNLLEYDLGSSTAELEVAAEECRQIKITLEDEQKRNRDKDLKIWRLEEDNADLREEIRRSRKEIDVQSSRLEKARDEISEKESEIFQLKKDLEESKLKNLELEMVLRRQEREFRDIERRGLKFPWPAVASAGTVVAATIVYLSCARQRR